MINVSQPHLLLGFKFPKGSPPALGCCASHLFYHNITPPLFYSRDTHWKRALSKSQDLICLEFWELLGLYGEAQTSLWTQYSTFATGRPFTHCKGRLMHEHSERTRLAGQRTPGKQHPSLEPTVQRHSGGLHKVLMASFCRINAFLGKDRH